MLVETWSQSCEGFKLYAHLHRSSALTDQRFPRFFFTAPSRGGDGPLFLAVFAFFSIRAFHAVWSAPLSTSSLAAARRICVCPIFPQPPGIGKKISGASSTNAACCSIVSIRFPYPCACEASEANFLPPTRKAGNPAWEYSSTPSRLSAILRKSAAAMGDSVDYGVSDHQRHMSTAPG